MEIRHNLYSRVKANEIGASKRPICGCHCSVATRQTRCSTAEVVQVIKLKRSVGVYWKVAILSGALNTQSAGPRLSLIHRSLPVVSACVLWHNFVEQHDESTLPESTVAAVSDG